MHIQHLEGDQWSCDIVAGVEWEASVDGGTPACGVAHVRSVSQPRNAVGLAYLISSGGQTAAWGASALQ